MDNEGSQALEEKSTINNAAGKEISGGNDVKPVDSSRVRQVNSNPLIDGRKFNIDDKNNKGDNGEVTEKTTTRTITKTRTTEYQSSANAANNKKKPGSRTAKGYMPERMKPRGSGANTTAANRVRGVTRNPLIDGRKFNTNEMNSEEENAGGTGATESSSEEALQNREQGAPAAVDNPATSEGANEERANENTSSSAASSSQSDSNGKSAKVDIAKKIGKKVLKIILAALGPIFFLILIIVVLLLPFIAGFSLLADFIGDLFDSTEEEYFGVPAVSESTAVQASIAVVSTVPGYDTYSPARKAFISSAAVGIGSPYTPNGEPTSNNYNGLSNGVDGFGFYQWVIWNTSLFNIGHLTPKAVADSDFFIKLDEAEILPGDIGVNDNDVGVYMGDNQWIHYDSTSNTFIQSTFEGYTSFYKYYNLEKTDTSTETTTSTAE